MERVIEYRRRLHQIPELAMQEEQTGNLIFEHLSTLGCKVERIATHGSLAFFNNGARDTVAFRADIDALAIAEQTGLAFASQNGRMHACGHDGHTAMLLAFADHLSAHHGDYQKNLLLIFQPAEESIGGASRICEQGVLERYGVRAIFAMHIWPGIEKGALACTGGPVMARTSEVRVRIAGKSAHCAYPALGIDALVAGVQLVARLERFKAEEIPADRRFLLHYGVFHSGDARNIISQRTEIEMSVRAFDDALFDFMLRRIKELAAEIDRQHQTATEVLATVGYPVVLNDPELVRALQKSLPEQGIRTAVQPQNMGGEDFSYYLKRVPGVMLYLGAGDTPPLHNSRFTFDEAILQDGVRGLIAIANRFAR